MTDLVPASTIKIRIEIYSVIDYPTFSFLYYITTASNGFNLKNDNM